MGEIESKFCHWRVDPALNDMLSSGPYSNVLDRMDQITSCECIPE